MTKEECRYIISKDNYRQYTDDYFTRSFLAKYKHHFPGMFLVRNVSTNKYEVHMKKYNKGSSLEFIINHVEEAIFIIENFDSEQMTKAELSSKFKNMDMDFDESKKIKEERLDEDFDLHYSNIGGAG